MEALVGEVSAPLRNMFGGAFDGARVFVTGHTGFKGSWLSLWLSEMGATVAGYALEPYTAEDVFVVAGAESVLQRHTLADVRDAETLATAVISFSPDLVLHLAAQPLVRLSYERPAETYDTNVVGTANLLDAVRAAGHAATVVVTSDKCYRNLERVEPYTEDDALGGHDPYSSSKACQELVTSAYRDSFFAPVGREAALKTVRAGNVIGGGDWAADRIVPDAVRALRAGDSVPVRNPDSVRPWQHVLEPLGGYLTLAARMLSGDAPASPAYNFGPDAAASTTVGSLMDVFVDEWGTGEWIHTPQPGAVHEAALLTLDAGLARRELGWAPVLSAEECVAWTAGWYRGLVDGADMPELTRQQIAVYSSRLVDVLSSSAASGPDDTTAEVTT